jgi:hypothetical protein
MPGPSHDHFRPALTLSQARSIAATMSPAEITAIIERAIDESDCKGYLRQELVGMDLSDPFWVFFALDLLAKYTNVLSYSLGAIPGL